MADITGIIEAAARKHGVEPEALLAIAQLESGFNTGADNPFSSASGLFQFTDSTARDFGLTGDKRNDAEAQADAAARMAAINSKALERALGREPSAGEVYLAHQQGLGGALALLSNPNAPAAQVLSRFYGNNAGDVIRQNGGNPNMTAGQFAGMWVNKGNQSARLFPPGEIPQVATALDVVPRVPPRPATPSPDMRLMRNPAMSSTAAPPPLPRPRPSTEDMVTGRANSMPGADLSLTGRTNPTTSRMRDDGEVLNPFFSDLTPTAVVGGVGSLTPGRVPPVPAMQSPHLAAQRARNPELQTALNSRFPVQLPPLPPPANVAGRVAPVPAIPSLPLQSARLAAGAVNPTLDAALGPDQNAIPERLTASPAGLPGVGMSPTQVAAIGTDTSGATTAVGGPGSGPFPFPVIQSDALRERRNRPPPPLPIPRPGVGGPVVPPVPAPRLDRPGVFGNTPVPLPGALGMIQRFTKAMNNASGPFNNGFDNLLVQTMRGRSHATPGAATATAGGFLYAPKPGGGWVNVGRAPRSTPSPTPSRSTAGLRPGDRRYNPDTNTWEIK